MKRIAKLLFTLPAAAILFAGCSSVGRVTLLPEEGRPASALEVRTARGAEVLSRPYQTAAIGGNGQINVEASSEAEVSRKHPSLLSLRPKQEARFVLYFAPGGTMLTPDSQSLVSKLIAEAVDRPGGEFVIVGHTDTTGTAESNDALSLQRAQAVKQILVDRGASGPIETVGRGKREPLIPTADQVDEPKNRRVEVLVR